MTAPEEHETACAISRATAAQPPPVRWPGGRPAGRVLRASTSRKGAEISVADGDDAQRGGLRGHRPAGGASTRASTATSSIGTRVGWWRIADAVAERYGARVHAQRLRRARSSAALAGAGRGRARPRGRRATAGAGRPHADMDEPRSAQVIARTVRGHRGARPAGAPVGWHTRSAARRQHARGCWCEQRLPLRQRRLQRRHAVLRRRSTARATWCCPTPSTPTTCSSSTPSASSPARLRRLRVRRLRLAVRARARRAAHAVDRPAPAHDRPARPHRRARAHPAAPARGAAAPGSPRASRSRATGSSTRRRPPPRHAESRRDRAPRRPGHPPRALRDAAVGPARARRAAARAGAGRRVRRQPRAHPQGAAAPRRTSA